MEEKRFINRELSWLEFNKRVLEEVTYQHNPIFERLKFASIVSSNLDEFFMIRVASVHDQIQAGLKKVDPSGLSTKAIMNKISEGAHKLVEELYQKYNLSLIRGLKKEKICILKKKDLTAEQEQFLDEYFNKIIFPVLTPMAVDIGRPFPLVLNKSLNIAALVADYNNKKNYRFTTVQVPSVLERLIELPSSGNKRQFILLEEIIKMKLKKIFVGYHILAKANYRVTRNADLSINEEGAEDLLEVIEESLRQRKWGVAIRLEIEKGADSRILNRLLSELEISENQVYMIPGPIDLNFLKKISGLKGYEHLLYPLFKPASNRSLRDSESIFEEIRRGDILMHHPYHSFNPIIDLVKNAAEDPQVLAIKQTLYRVSDNSPIVEALVSAAENGKQVTVMVEIKARFDEQNNIQWAKRLETAGCHVIYGFAGLKTHCKILLIVRREEDEIVRYVHMSTGNYNEETASLYTDISLLTANAYFGIDASNLFNMLSGLSQPLDMNRICLAPYNLREKMMELIIRERDIASRGGKAKIIMKLNSLVDTDIIEALYLASQAGVIIDLIVRGICCLKPKIPNVSDNITVFSIVGRFLEHSRIFYFYNDGEEKIYLSSADLMERNLDRRIEVIFPIDDQILKLEVKRILNICLSDTEKSRTLLLDGTYKRNKGNGKNKVISQVLLYQEALEVINTKSNNKEEGIS
jgi:polyphosphate kinase